VAGRNNANGRGRSYVVPCRVEPGMFRGEYLVYLDALNPNNPKQEVKAQLFADERDVKDIVGQPGRNHPASAWLAVSLVRKGNGLALIVLPQPAQPFGETLLINEEKVKDRAAA
jgi:hypothetical protein